MSTTWLYGVRSEIRVCGVASFQAALRLAKSLIPRGRLPDGVELAGSVSKQRFLLRIRRLLTKIDRKRVFSRANATKVTATQREKLVKLLISFGYTDDNYLRLKKPQLPALTTTQEETGHGNSLGVHMPKTEDKGAPTKSTTILSDIQQWGLYAFQDMESLSRWVASQFGSNWSSMLQARGAVSKATITSSQSISSRVPYGDLLHLPGYREQTTLFLMFQQITTVYFIP